MEIRYDEDADALYIEFAKGKFARNQKVDEFTIIDYDSDGKMIGMEVLDVSKRFPRKSFSELSVKNIEVTQDA